MESGWSRRHVLGGAATAAAGVAIAGVLPAAAAHADPPTADLVIHNARVLILDKQFRSAEAVAVRDGLVLAVGRNKDMRRLTGLRTEVLDAEGGTVLPGINDSHLHLNSFGIEQPPFWYDVDTATIAELVDAVRAAVAEAPTPDSWIRGEGWNDNRLPRPPRAADLDPVSGDHPVVLTDFSAHAMTVNSIVLRLAGITRDTEPPPGGVIEKDADGEPTGVLRETAQNLVNVPPFTWEQISQAIDAGIAQLHALGITSLTEPGIGLDLLDLYADKARSGNLPMRITALLGPEPRGSIPSLEDLIAEYEPLRDVDPQLLRVAGIKLHADGVPTAAKTAFLHEPYLDGSNGSLVTTGDTVAEQIQTLHRQIKLAASKGFQVGTHATGDAAIDAVVAGYLDAMGPGWRREDLRHYVIHGDLTPPATLRKMARYDIGVNMNATIKYLLGRTLDPVLGPERTNYQWPYRTALDLGVRVSSGSDASVTWPSWLQGVMAAVLREGRFGGVAGKAERITVPEALATYTRTPAWQDHAERWKGTLQRGKVADICVVGGDVLGVDPHDLVDLPITATVLGGRVVYERSSRRTDARTAAVAASAGAHRRGLARLQAGQCCGAG